MTKVEILEEYLQNLIKEKSECQNEEKIAEINERISCIADITKLVVRELNTAAGSEQEYLIKVINAVFSSTAAIHVKTVDDDLTVEIFDNFLKKTVLTLNFKHYGCNLYFQSYKLGIEADQEVEVQSQLKDGISKFGIPSTVYMAEDKKQLREANERLNKSKLRIREFCRGNINTR